MRLSVPLWEPWLGWACAWALVTGAKMRRTLTCVTSFHLMCLGVSLRSRSHLLPSSLSTLSGDSIFTLCEHLNHGISRRVTVAARLRPVRAPALPPHAHLRRHAHTATQAVQPALTPQPRSASATRTLSRLSAALAARQRAHAHGVCENLHAAPRVQRPCEKSKHLAFAAAAATGGAPAPAGAPGAAGGGT